MLKKKQVIFFSKMHGLGNDFVILERINQKFFLSSEVIQKLSDRNTGIGFDQLLIVDHSKNVNYDFYYRIFNANGTEAMQCGNGARCFAYFVYLKKITQKKKITVQTKSSNIIIKIINKNNIIVDMGQPKFNEINVPEFELKNFSLKKITIDNIEITYGTVFIGNPHCVIIVKNVNTYPIHKIGKLLNEYDLFPDGINVNFMQIISLDKIILRVYERGVGETQACGSGACASVVYGIMQGILSEKVIVTLPGGELEISWNGFGHSVYMNGPAKHVYDGYIKIDI